MGARTLATAVSAIALLVAGCSGSDGVDEVAGPEVTQPASVDDGNVRALVDEPGLRVDVESTSSLGAGSLEIQLERSASDPGEGDGGIVIGDVYGIGSLDPLSETLTLRMPVQEGAEPADQAIAYFDTALGAWVAVETTRSGDWLSAESDHLSEWTIVDLPTLIAWWTARLAGLRADPPMCAGPTPEWVTAINIDTGPNAELRVCAETDDRDRLELKVVNNRAVPTWIVLSHGTSEPPQTSSDAALATVIAQIAEALGRDGSAEIQSAAQVILVPGLGSTDLTFDQETVIGPGSEGEVEATLVGNSRRGVPVVAGYLASELLTILGGDSALAVSVSLYECASQADQWDDLDWGSSSYPIVEYLRSYIDCVGTSATTALAAADNPKSDSLGPLRRLNTFLKWFEAARLVTALADVSIDSLDRAGDDIRVSVDYCGAEPTVADIATRTWETDVMGTVETVDGRFDGSGGFFELLSETFLVADLNDDCQQDIVIVSRENGGGSGVFYRLRILVADRGRFDEVNVIPMGDRIVVESVRHDAGGVRLELVVQAPGAGLAGPEVETAPWLTYAELRQASSLPEELTLPAEESSGGPITHAEIKAGFAAVEPNIHYVGSCDGTIVFDDQTPPGATPFCGTIVANTGDTADITITDDSGFQTALRFARVNGAWTWDLN